MKNNKNIYTIFVIFTIASLFLVVFIILPLLKEIEKNSQDLISAKNNIVTLEAQAVETKNFKENYDAYKPNLEKIDRLFINPNDPVDFIKFLENAALNSQITSQISLPLSSAGEKQNFIVFQFSSKGSPQAVRDFLKKIEGGPYMIEIESMTIKNSEKSASGLASVSNDSSPKTVDATFTIKVFTKPL